MGLKRFIGAQRHYWYSKGSLSLKTCWWLLHEKFGDQRGSSGLRTSERSFKLNGDQRAQNLLGQKCAFGSFLGSLWLTGVQNGQLGLNFGSQKDIGLRMSKSSFTRICGV